jgi:hypothetical protein
MRRMFRSVIAGTVIVTVLVIAQRKQIAVARTKLEEAKAGRVQEGSRASLTASVSPDIEREIARLRSENRDIFKLRGQISQARQKRREVEGLQAQNAKYRRQIEEAKTNPGGSGSFPLLNKGQGTPEAALETGFWSMYQGDLQSVGRIMPIMAGEFERMPPTERTNSVMMLKAMASAIQSMEIMDRKSDSPDEVYLTVQMNWREGMNLNSTFGPKKSTFVLRRTNDLWQVVAEHRLE